MKKKNLKKIVFKIIIFIVVLALGIFIGKNINSDKSSTKSKTTSSSSTSQVVSEDVTSQEIKQTITSSGEITASDTEKVYTTSGKYFSEMCVETNDEVKSGANLLKYSDGTYLTAPYDCVVKSYSVPSSGTICTSSYYLELENVEKMDMTLSISESEINEVAVGQSVEIVLNADSTKTYTGTITKIDSIGTYATSGTTFSATVEFDNDGSAKIGMSANCTIVINDEKDAVAVPIKAVQTNGEQKYVVLVNSDGTTSNVNVTTGISNDTYVEILSGLSVGQKVQMVEITTTNSGWSGRNSGGSMPSGSMPGGTTQSGKSTSSSSTTSTSK